MGGIQEEKIKVFLAEDEVVVREGIKKNIDWESHGFVFCGDASDGELALPLIKKEKPDILITDIRMPFMDGLELSNLVKQELPETEIIILSGFEEFEYAREAIKIGVAEYLTKPISAQDLLAGIERVADEIRKRREDELMKAKYLREMQESLSLEKKELFKSLVSGGSSVSDIIHLAEKLNVNITALCYNIVFLICKSDRHDQNEFSGSIVKFSEEIECLSEELGALSFDRTPEGKAYLFLADSVEQINEKIQSFTNSVEASAKAYPSLSFFGGIGKSVSRISEIPDSYQVASRAFAYRFFEGSNRFVESEDLIDSLTGIEVNRDDFNVNDINPKKVDRDELEGFLKIGSAEEAEYFADAYFKEIGDSALKSAMFRQFIVLNTYFAVTEFVEQIGKDRDMIETFSANSDFLKSVEETTRYIVRILTEAINMRESISRSKYDSLVKNVCQYVEDNFACPELSLNDIAAYVNFSPSHLSMVFSQEMDMTLIRYITDVRMNKAKELLRCTSKRSSEISMQVGYQDPHYFSYLFKKTQGITPTDFRNGKEPLENLLEVEI